MLILPFFPLGMFVSSLYLDSISSICFCVSFISLFIIFLPMIYRLGFGCGFITTSNIFKFLVAVMLLDGQQMDGSDDGSNFVINTCEWLNGPHVLFATAKAQSGFSGPSGLFSVSIGQGVSPYVSVNFTNLISEIAFSQPLFQPSLGQTQQVSAIFAANVNWTLQIIDDFSNAVRNVSGSGTSLAFNWNGTGDGGTNIPDGVYYYVISAQTNGQAFSMSEPLLNSSSKLTPVDSLELWAMPANGSSAVPLAIFPPGFDTNGFLIFEATQSEMQPQQMSSLSVDPSYSMNPMMGLSEVPRPASAKDLIWFLRR